MFSGIVETQSEIVEIQESAQSLQLSLQKPSHFNDLKIGDSIACNGVCLTLEDFNETTMKFTLAAETLHITGWTVQKLKSLRNLNLERSMALSDRVHGHFVLGHVDGMAQVKELNSAGDSKLFKVEFPSEFRNYIWKKGSITLNGVSLTINSVESNVLEVCLIPETLKRTNLSHLSPGDWITFEVDSMARAFVHLWKMEKENVQV